MHAPKGHKRSTPRVDSPLAARLWAIDLALRCPGVDVVVADASGLDMAATRRLQLSAEAGGALGLLARPEEELTELSAAATRWLVREQPSPGSNPRWQIQLLRCKTGGLGETPGAPGAPGISGSGSMPAQTGTDAPSVLLSLIVEWNGAQSAVAVPSQLVDRSDPATPPQVRGTGGESAHPRPAHRRQTA
jgi:hypothetical protein